MQERIVVEKDGKRALPHRRMSWAAVLAGVVVALSAQLLLSLLGVGIGASTFDPVNKENPAAGMGFGAVVWLALSAMLSLFAGGWTASRLGGMRPVEGVMQGVLTWSLVTLVSFALLTTTIGAVIGGAARGLGQTASLLGQGTASAAPAVASAAGEVAKDQGFDWESVKREARAFLRETGKPALDPDVLEGKAKSAKQDAKAAAKAAAEDPLAADEEMRTLLARLFGRFRDAADAADREALVNVVAARTGKSKSEAEQVVVNWERAYDRAKEKYTEVKAKAEEKARDAAAVAASAVARFAFWSFAGLLFGLGAAAAGGLLGSHDSEPVLGVTVSAPRVAV